jgi:WD40 repeat protein
MREREIFIEALQKDAPAERAAYLDSACGGDDELRGRVDGLLAEHRSQKSFILDSPPPSVDATVEPDLSLDPPILLLPAGTMIGRYKLLEPIGEGGYGVVFMAEQTTPVHRKVALKIIKAGMDTRQVIARFEAERQALALMDHPNIAKVFDAGTTDTGRPYFVMELVKGVPITKYCDEHHIEPRQRLELFMQVCQAVQHAHQKGIIHRDLKPSNVLVALYDGKPVPKVIDFGVAKATGQQLTERTMFTSFGDVIGTLEYMSPEQAEVNQLDVDTRSDIYSLGVLLYELLTGSTPLEHKRVLKAGLLEMLRVVREEEPPKPSIRLSTTEQLPSIAANRGLEPKKLGGLVKGELDWIVMKALEKDRSRRYETANSMASDVQRYLSDEAVHACPPSARYRFRKFARRNKHGLAAAAALALVLVLGSVVSTWQALRARRAQGVSLTRLKGEQQARQRASDAEQAAVDERGRAELNLAHSLVEQANALEVVAGPSRSRPVYQQARDAFTRLKASPLSAELGLLDSYDRNPPALIELTGHTDGILHIDLSRDGRFALTASKDGTLKYWELRTGRVLHTLVGHEHWVIRCAISPDGKSALSAGDDKDHQVRLWDLETGRQVRALDGHTAPGRVVIFAADGKHAVSGGQDYTLRMWELSSGKQLWVQEEGAAVRAAAFSPDGASILVGLDKTPDGGKGLLLVETASGRRLRDYPTQRVGAVCFHSDGRHAFSATYQGELRRWDLRTGESKLFREGADVAVALSPDDRRLLAASQDGTVAIWDAENGERTQLFFGMTEAARSVAWSHDNRFVMAAGLDGTLRVWTLGDDHEFSKATVTYPMSYDFSPDGRIVTLLGRSMLALRDAATMMPLADMSLPANKSWVATIFDRRFASWSTTDASRMLELPTCRELFRLSVMGRVPGWLCTYLPERSLMAFADNHEL